MSFGITFVYPIFFAVTFHSGKIRSCPAAQFQVLTCPEATEAIAVIFNNFVSSKSAVPKNFNRILTFSLGFRIHLRSDHDVQRVQPGTGMMGLISDARVCY